MPISALGTYWPAVKRMIEAKPKTVLDLGAGTGRYGLTVRDFVEYLCYKSDPTDRETWQIHLEGVEVYRPYLRSPLYDFYYDRVHNTDAREFMAKAHRQERRWDVVLCMDMIEHVPESDARELVNHIMACANSYAIVSSPYGKRLQEPVLGNEWEVHQFTLMEDFFDPWKEHLEQLWKVDRCLLAVLRGHNPSGPGAPTAATFEVTGLLRGRVD